VSKGVFFILLITSYNINDLNIDEVTAWLIGWNNVPKARDEIFRPISG